MFVLNGNSEQVVNAFKSFGLCKNEAKVYFALQVCGKTKAGELWKKSGVPQSRVYYTVELLIMRGLVEITQQHPLEVRSKPFLRFANDFLQEKKCLLNEIEDMIEDYREALRGNGKFVQVLG